MNISGMHGGADLHYPQKVRAERESKEAAGAEFTSVMSKVETGTGVVVSLSEEAQVISRADSQPVGIAHTTRWLRNNPDQSEVARYVEFWVKTPSDELVSVVDEGRGVYRVYYASTGLPVTPESSAYFKELDQKVVAERTQIFNEEMAKGTPPIDIWEKIQRYMSEQPIEYLQMMNWH